MSNATSFAIGFIFVAVLESLIIIVGNLFTIFVFRKHRHRLKRTSFLLINLAVADLLVGVTEPVVIGTYKISGEHQDPSINSTNDGHISIIFQTTFSFASIFFLVLISLERTYALIWPLRHRVASTRGYIYSAIFVWLAAISKGTLSFLAVYGVLYYATWIVFSCFIIIFCLIVICASYLTIRTRLKCRIPAVDMPHNRQNRPEQNAKLSRTLFIVIAASLVCWFPSTVVYSFHYLCSKCVSLILIQIFNIFRLANSIVNPIIYSFRIPLFRETLKGIKVLKQSKRYRVNYRP